MVDFTFMDNWRARDGAVLLQGHRGARGHIAENTMDSFICALDNGCTSIELDVLASQDDILVVTHNAIMSPAFTQDAENNWIVQGDYKIRELTYQQLQHLNVGAIDPNSDYGKTFCKQTPLDKGTIPTLEDVFKLLKRPDFQQAWINIEIKSNPNAPHLTMPIDTLVPQLSQLVEQYHMQQRVVIQSFDWNVCLAMQDYNPKLATSYLSEIRQPHSDNESNIYENSPWMGGLSEQLTHKTLPEIIAGAGGKMWAPYYQDLKAEHVAIAKDLGLVVYTWTVNEPKHWQDAIDAGVDGIITDYPMDARSYFSL